MLPLNLPQKNYITGFWKLDEESGIRYDETDNNNDLTDNNTVLYGAGKIDNAADFESGNSEYLSIADGDQTGLDITSSFTICAWINPESLHATANALIGKYTEAGNLRCYIFWIYASKLRFFVSSDGINNVVVAGDTALGTGSYQHVACRFDDDANEIEVFLNGVSDATPVAHAAGIADKASPFHIGYHVISGNPYYFDGLIDEVIIWNIALSDAEILQVKNISSYQYGGGLGIGNPYIF